MTVGYDDDNDRNRYNTSKKVEDFYHRTLT